MPRKIFLTACMLTCALAPLRAKDAKPAPEPMDDQHVREELGVNAYTSPAIADLLDELRLLKPISFGDTRRELPAGPFANRAQAALNLGGLVGDAFLLVVVEKQGNAEAVARQMLKLAKSLAISDSVTSHADSLGEMVARNEWKKLQRELVAMQGDVEKALMQLRDEEVSHLIALGGWVRGLQICAKTVASNYTPERSGPLIQPDLMGYFLDRLSTLQPKWQDLPLFVKLRDDLAEVKKIADASRDESLTKDQVKELLRLATEMNDAIATPIE